MSKLSKTEMSRVETEARFWSKVKVRGPDECWFWLGSVRKDGHPVFKFHGLSVYSQRMVWVFKNGWIGQQDRIRATCGSLLCMNPAHIVKTCKEVREHAVQRPTKTDQKPKFKIDIGSGEGDQKTTGVGRNGKGAGGGVQGTQDGDQQTEDWRDLPLG